ncbi:hypothetical protein AVEN_81525-1 [Araneus ventricosus]|uniref:Uncharacterized protein n=1 Tax=Araneus ventricosus TaxID=182803 RepID=A0A4Y2NZI6_ARAVE|nr:hypothetical protein AVEN_81525-1 [Araneus ventricosus]
MFSKAFATNCICRFKDFSVLWAVRPYLGETFWRARGSVCKPSCCVFYPNAVIDIDRTRYCASLFCDPWTIVSMISNNWMDWSLLRPLSYGVTSIGGIMVESRSG